MAITFYRSFLLRLWRETGPEGEIWAGEIELIQSGERVTVSSPHEAVAMILQVTTERDESLPPTGEASLEDRSRDSE